LQKSAQDILILQSYCPKTTSPWLRAWFPFFNFHLPDLFVCGLHGGHIGKVHLSKSTFCTWKTIHFTNSLEQFFSQYPKPHSKVLRFQRKVASAASPAILGIDIACEDLVRFWILSTSLSNLPCRFRKSVFIRFSEFSIKNCSFSNSTQCFSSKYQKWGPPCDLNFSVSSCLWCTPFEPMACRPWASTLRNQCTEHSLWGASTKSGSKSEVVHVGFCCPPCSYFQCTANKWSVARFYRPVLFKNLVKCPWPQRQAHFPRNMPVAHAACVFSALILEFCTIWVCWLSLSLSKRDKCDMRDLRSSLNLKRDKRDTHRTKTQCRWNDSPDSLVYKIR